MCAEAIYVVMSLSYIHLSKKVLILNYKKHSVRYEFQKQERKYL